MKKLLFCVISMFFLLSIITVCYAGDVPETLLGDDSSQVYFGEIKIADEESITIIQHQNVKGEFSKGSELTYTKFAFTDSPKIGGVYLCGYIDDSNPLYVWDVTSLDTKTLKINNTDDMSKRMQKYLNDGTFEEKEKERLSKIDTESTTKYSSEVPTSNDGTVQVDSVRQGNIFLFTLILSGIILIGIVLVLWIRNKNHKPKE